jgi:ubiquinol-cytochrome c reductase subunit 7
MLSSHRQDINGRARLSLRRNRTVSVHAHDVSILSRVQARFIVAMLSSLLPCITQRQTLISFVCLLGLRYEDLINENDPDMEEALTLADYDILTGRNRRLKRAIDLDFKKKFYTDYAPSVAADTFKFELEEDIQKIRGRNLEYAILNSYKK